jgi:hypothetical protein
MESIYILIGAIVIIIFLYLIYESYDMSCIFDCEEPSHEPVLNSKIYKARCPPPQETQVHAKPIVPINTYDEKTNVKNKGFVNELMYRPNTEMYEYNFETNDYPNDRNVPLNPTCDLSTDLPLPNVHISYLLQKNSARLT